MEGSYLKFNRDVYDSLASEFKSKIKIRENNSKIAVNFFDKYFNNKLPKKVLELGPGSGYVCKLLTQMGYKTIAIEFSPKMAAICRKTSPKTKIIVDEFLKYDFGKNKFSGIITLAFIHLFPKAETQKVLSKIKNLLSTGGIAFLSTTMHRKSEEGLFVKSNFNKKLPRFRRRFTQKEFEKELSKAGFKMIDVNYVPDREEKGKVWMDYIVGLR